MQHVSANRYEAATGIEMFLPFAQSEGQQNHCRLVKSQLFNLRRPLRTLTDLPPSPLKHSHSGQMAPVKDQRVQAELDSLQKKPKLWGTV